MHHPYQRLTVCVPGTGAQFLLAASGHKLFSVNLADGSVVTQWPKEGPNEALEEKVRSIRNRERAWVDKAGDIALL